MRQGRNSVRSSARWRVSVRLLTVLTVAVTVTTVLFLSGCATRRRSVTTQRDWLKSESWMRDSVSAEWKDSASEFVELRTESVKVPMSEVVLSIPSDSLRRLPPGASYRGRSGQASVAVSRKSSTATEPEYIYVYATCDSLQLQCERYKRQIIHLRSDYGERLSGLGVELAESRHEVEELRERSRNGIGTSLKWYSGGVLTGIILLTIIIRKRRKL